MGSVPESPMTEAPKVEAPAKAPKRRWKKVAAGLVLYLIVEAVALPAAWQPTARLGVGLIRAYQTTLSPLLSGAGVHCRFQPTCSHYAADTLLKHGTLAGGLRSAWRLLRCAPWGPPPGTVDEP
jgi:uncharacterized protein